MGEAEGEFPSFLKSRLPQGNQIRVYHVSTLPSSCPPLFAPGPGRSDETTTLESHFLAISQFRQQADDSLGQLSDVLVLGIEVLIFTTSNLTTVFVSKADSTGFLTRPIKGASQAPSLAQVTITAFLEFLLKSRLDRSRLVLSLFARSQSQYLFPGSVENVTKHVLDDRQLIKWWCRVLHPVARSIGDDIQKSVKAHVVVPGCDASETNAFFPTSARSNPSSNPTWVNAYPVKLLVEDATLPVRCLVPRLPDDPKSRFLEDLDTHRDENGSWRGIKTLDQFWEMMSYRQECSAGRLVGFVWVVFSPTEVSKVQDTAVNDETQEPQKKEAHGEDGPRQQQIASRPHFAPLTVSLTEKVESVASQEAHSSSRPGGSAVIEPVLPPLRAVETTTTTIGQPQALQLPLPGSNLIELAHSPEATAVQSIKAKEMTTGESKLLGAALLSADDYQTLMDELLQLDFAGEQLAVQSTRTWREKATSMAGASTFGTVIEGIAVFDDEPVATNVPSSTSVIVNVLTATRKKRKAEHTETSPTNGKIEERPAVNMLPTNLVRKKPKG